MSRSWTPKEMFYVDKEMAKSGKSFRDNRLVLVDEKTGEETQLNNHLAVGRYPELSFLFDLFDDLYIKSEGRACILKVFDEYEAALVRAENGDAPKTEIEKTVEKWYNGKLDDSFYYNDWNNKLLFVDMLDAADKALKKEIRERGR
jgi:hypothetical protein